MSGNYSVSYTERTLHLFAKNKDGEKWNYSLHTDISDTLQLPLVSEMQFAAHKLTLNSAEEETSWCNNNALN
jgi:hypothetical protein